MKRLTKIRLINWHYFENETININSNTLLTGQNASGKSTIMDAITFVITAGDQNFNLAANEKGKRDLRSYVKCKLGSLDQEYLRDYDLTGHICLEYYSEKLEKYFCLGAIIDVVGQIAPPKVVFYIIDGPMKDDYFITDEYVVKNIQEFRKSKVTDYIYTTRKEAKSAFRNKMGGISEKYFTLLPKALAFKPISDVKDYIYQHLLDEKKIDTENIRDSIRSYKEFEGILKTTKAKIDDLTVIKETYEQAKTIRENKDFYDYMLKVLNVKESERIVESKRRLINQFETEEAKIKNELRSLDEEIANEDDRGKQMYASLTQNKDFRNSEIYDRDIKASERELEFARESKREYDRKVKAFTDSLEALKNIDPKLHKELSKINFNIESTEDYLALSKDLDHAKEIVDQKSQSLVEERSVLEVRKNEKLAEIKNIFESLNQLGRNSLPYSPELVQMRARMEEALKKTYGEAISVHVLSEIIEVKDKSWQDTVENLLNQQRFTLIVEPKYYDDCLDVYNEYKSKNMYGISLLNTKKIQGFTSHQKNSLASIIQTENKDAQCYINYSIGNLIMVDDVHDLEKYSQAITKEGMLYRGFIARYLNPNIPKPFIGSNARQAQLDKYNKLGQQAKEDFQKLGDQISRIGEARDVLSTLDVTVMKGLLKEVSDVSRLTEKIKDLKEKKAHLSLSSVSELRQEYENVQSGIKVLNQKKESLLRQEGTKEQAIQSLNDEIVTILEANKALSLEIEEIEKSNTLYESKAQELYDEKHKSGKNEKDIQQDISEEISEGLSSLKALEGGLMQRQIGYISQYNRPFGTGYESTPQYLEELDKLVQSELVKYENKVREAREEAEKLFKEDFLSKLRSYILEAQDEIQKINDTLNKISFGKDKYQFVFPKSKEFGAIYDMITDQGSEKMGYSIFDQEFEDRYQKELDELFNKLSSDEENSQGALNKYTDYRTYMDYDIKIISGDDVFYYSNISKEKSGGETQIPFYVAILASFVRLFDKAEKNGLDDSVGLILFDEVFDKMDNTRTDAMMQFIHNLPVQIILACPPQKMENLQAHTETTVAVFREGKKAGTVVVQTNHNQE